MTHGCISSVCGVFFYHTCALFGSSDGPPYTNSSRFIVTPRPDFHFHTNVPWHVVTATPDLRSRPPTFMPLSQTCVGALGTPVLIPGSMKQPPPVILDVRSSPLASTLPNPPLVAAHALDPSSPSWWTSTEVQFCSSRSPNRHFTNVPEHVLHAAVT